jgi:hypothetical protein
MAGGIDSLESIPGLHKSLKMPALFATAALWVRIQKSLKKSKWATQATEWPTHPSPQKINKTICNLKKVNRV